MVGLRSECWYLTKNVSIECHHCALNDELIEDENVVVVEINDSKVMDEEGQEDEWNKMDVRKVVEAIVVENVRVVVVAVDDDDGGGDEMDDRSDAVKREVSIVKLLSSMIEAKELKLVCLHTFI